MLHAKGMMQVWEGICTWPPVHPTLSCSRCICKESCVNKIAKPFPVTCLRIF